MLRGVKGGGFITYKKMESLELTDKDVDGKTLEEVLSKGTPSKATAGLSAGDYEQIKKYVTPDGEFTKAYYSDYKKDYKLVVGSPERKISKSMVSIINKVPGLTKYTPEELPGNPAVVSMKQLNVMANAKTVGKTNIGIGATAMNMEKPMARALRRSIEENTTIYLTGGYAGFSSDTYFPKGGGDTYWKASNKKIYQVDPYSVTQKNKIPHNRWRSTPLMEVQ